MDLNTHSTINDLHASVDSPCISSKNFLDKSLYDMLALSCCHDENACVPSNSCINNNVEETQFAMQQDVNLSSSKINFSSSSTHHCLMAKSSSSNDNKNDNNDEEDDEENNDALLHEKGIMILKALSKNKNACDNLYEIMGALVERRETIEALEASLEEKGRIEREDANEKASLEDALEEEHETRASLEEKLNSIEESHNEIIAKIIKERDHAHAKYKVTKKENARLNEELAKLSPSIPNTNDACATNSISCEASTLKENVELRAQLELLTSKYEKLEASHEKLSSSNDNLLASYGKLEENHEKLSSSNDELLASYACLKLAHEAITTKVTSCEPHVDKGTTLSTNAILPCASPSSSSTDRKSTRLNSSHRSLSRMPSSA